LQNKIIKKGYTKGNSFYNLIALQG